MTTIMPMVAGHRKSSRRSWRRFKRCNSSSDTVRLIHVFALPGLMKMRYGYKPHTIHEYEQLSNEIRKEMARRGVAANAGCLTRKLLIAPSTT